MNETLRNQLLRCVSEMRSQANNLCDLLTTTPVEPKKPAGVIARPGDTLRYISSRNISLVRVVTNREFCDAYNYVTPPGRVPFFKGGERETYRGIDANEFFTLTSLAGEPIIGYEGD